MEQRRSSMRIHQKHDGSPFTVRNGHSVWTMKSTCKRKVLGRDCQGVSSNFKSSRQASKSRKRGHPSLNTDVCDGGPSGPPTGIGKAAGPPPGRDSAISLAASQNSNANHCPIVGPVTAGHIGREGGSLTNLGHVLQVPKGALGERTEMELGLVWNDSLRPAAVPGDCQMSAMLSCEPSGVCFKRPVSVYWPHCLQLSATQRKLLRPVLYTRKCNNDGQPVWERRVMEVGEFTLGPRRLEVRVYHFCMFMWTLEDGSEIEAKRVVLALYSSPTSVGDDQKVRLHVINDTDAMKERVKREEEELRGRRIVPYHSYVCLRNFNDLGIRVTWCMPGWSFPSNGSIPFKELWSCDHNSCELHFESLIGSSRFKCQLDIHQEGNESTVSMAVSYHLLQQMTSDGIIRKKKERGNEMVQSRQLERCTPFHSAPSRQQRLSSVPRDVKVYLPDVPGPPPVANSLLSFMDAQSAPGPRETVSASASPGFSKQDMKRSGGGPPIREDQLALVDDSLPPRRDLQLSVEASRDLDSCIPRGVRGQAFIQHYNQVNINYHVPSQPRNSDVYTELTSIVPLTLKNKLSLMLNDSAHPINNWSHLARFWKLEDNYSNKVALETPDKRGFAILTLAEEKKIITSLDDLIKGLGKIDREDCVDAVNEHMKKQSGSDSPEAMDCQESPSPTGEARMPSAPAGGLYHPGLDPPPQGAQPEAQPVPSRGNWDSLSMSWLGRDRDDRPQSIGAPTRPKQNMGARAQCASPFSGMVSPHSMREFGCKK